MTQICNYYGENVEKKSLKFRENINFETFCRKCVAKFVGMLYNCNCKVSTILIV